MLKRLAGIRFLSSLSRFLLFFSLAQSYSWWCSFLLPSLFSLGFGIWLMVDFKKMKRIWPPLIAFFSPRSESWVGVGVFLAVPFEAKPPDFARAFRAWGLSRLGLSSILFFYPVRLLCSTRSLIFGFAAPALCGFCCVMGGRGKRRRKNGKRRRADGSFLFLLLSYVSYIVYHLIIPYYSLALFTSLISLTYIYSSLLMSSSFRLKKFCIFWFSFKTFSVFRSSLKDFQCLLIFASLVFSSRFPFFFVSYFFLMVRFFLIPFCLPIQVSYWYSFIYFPYLNVNAIFL